MRQIKPGLFAAFLMCILAASIVAQDDEQPAAEQSAQPTAEQYDAVLRDIAGLQMHNLLLETQINDQERQVEELRAANEQVPQLERQSPALLVRMVEALQRFSALDSPCAMDERTE